MICFFRNLFVWQPTKKAILFSTLLLAAVISSGYLVKAQNTAQPQTLPSTITPNTAPALPTKNEMLPNKQVAPAHNPTNFPDLEYQIYLDSPALKIDSLRYAKDQTPILGKLSPDGKRIIMRNYQGGRVNVYVFFENGRHQSLTKSQCVIDPVIVL
ncbi:MAG: hypothetical protein IPI59_07730 [Sphingobacteriales bacterium]|nr:hypothetical protein [Sphingobacteriales bacterium]MBP9140362.1 hypothetical protein [Chitinophagales bacterium]MDA0199569.1 hypothetical protein [Bacteroidota bacterium]MBK6890050.1 hypothetical protein [Sphingobacteriales bacterium]MBK7527424.1 hypothetical protein [Sphingobacteriales bacterium]